MIKALFLTLALGLVAPSDAQESYAENLLREKIWEGYTEGFAVRTATPLSSTKASTASIW